MKNYTTVFWKRLFIVFVGLTIGGCAAAKPKERYFWPRLPETPRIEWLGTYWGTRDLVENSLLNDLIEKEIPMNLQSPLYLASDGNGRVYISDQKLGGVAVFDFNRKTVDLLGRDTTEKATFPTGVAVDGDGKVYSADTKSMVVYVYSPEGVPLGQRSLLSQVKAIGAMIIDAKRKRLIVPDVKGHQIVVFDLDGQKQFAFGKRGYDEGEFNFPTSAAVDKEGNIYVLDSQNARIQKFTPDGKFLMKFGKRGDRPGDFSMIKAVAVDSEGHIYVTDGKLHNFSIFDQEGQLLITIGGPYGFDGKKIMPAGFSIPNGIFIDKKDTIYIADQLNGRMQMFQYLNEDYLRRHPVTEGVAAEEQVQQEQKKKR